MDLNPVIQWLKAGCDPIAAAEELRMLQKAAVTPLTSEEITRAIQNIGMLQVHGIRGEMIEGMRNGEHRNYPCLRKFLALLGQT